MQSGVSGPAAGGPKRGRATLYLTPYPKTRGPHSAPCAAQDPRRLEDLTGLTELHSSAAALAADFDDDQASDDDGTLL